MNWLDFTCRVGTTVAAVAGSAAVGALTGSISGLFGGPAGMTAGAVSGAGIGAAGAVAKAGDICDKAAYDMYMRQKCELLQQGDMYVKVNGRQLATVKDLADRNFMPPAYYREIGACEEAGYLSTDSKLPP